MTREDIDNFVDSLETEGSMLIPDGLDDGFVGVSLEEDGGPRAVYSIEKCIRVLAKDMSHEEATEYFWFNVAGAGGDNYPIFITTPEDASPYT